MNAKGRFISLLLVVDSFFVGYAYGLNSRHVDVVDPSLPPLPVKKEISKEKPKEKALADKEDLKEKKDHHKKGAKENSKQAKHKKKDTGESAESKKTTGKKKKDENTADDSAKNKKNSKHKANAEPKKS